MEAMQGNGVALSVLLSTVPEVVERSGCLLDGRRHGVWESWRESGVLRHVPTTCAASATVRGVDGIPTARSRSVRAMPKASWRASSLPGTRAVDLRCLRRGILDGRVV